MSSGDGKVGSIIQNSGSQSRLDRCIWASTNVADRNQVHKTGTLGEKPHAATIISGEGAKHQQTQQPCLGKVNLYSQAFSKE